MEPKLYVVKVLDPGLKARYGETVHVTLDKANTWEKRGQGKIVGEAKLGVGEPLTAKDILPQTREGGYVTKEEGPRRFEDGE